MTCDRFHGVSPLVELRSTKRLGADRYRLCGSWSVAPFAANDSLVQPPPWLIGNVSAAVSDFHLPTAVHNASAIRSRDKLNDLDADDFFHPVSPRLLGYCGSWYNEIRRDY